MDLHRNRGPSGYVRDYFTRLTLSLIIGINRAILPVAV